MDDVIRHVFQYLNPHDLMRCRNVNRHWRRLASETFSRRTVLNFETEFQTVLSEPSYMSEIIEIYGKNLEEIQIAALGTKPNKNKLYYNLCLSTSPYHVTRDFMTSLSIHAPRLKRIKIRRMILTLAAIEKLEQLSETLELISIVDCSFPRSPDCREIIERSFCRLLKKAKNLQEFQFMGDLLFQKLELSSTVLKCISPTIRKLSISGALLQIDDLTFLQNKRLQSLTLNYILLQWSQELTKLDCLVETLEYLDVSKPSNIADFQAIACLRNLRELHANETDIDDESLITILRNCNKLQNLSISKCSRITINSLIELKMLPNLKSLNISSCNKITTEIVNILLQCNNLVDLDISHCYRIDTDSVEMLRQKFNLKRLLSNTSILPKFIPSLILGGNVAWRDFLISNYSYNSVINQ